VNSADSPILVTGVPGHVGGVGSIIVASLRRRGLPVRALTRREDERTDALRASGVEVATGDLTRPRDVHAALSGCRRMYFGLSVSPSYLEATATVAAVAQAHANLEVLVNISQMTVSQMSITETTGSPQQRLHWLCEQVADPAAHIGRTYELTGPRSLDMHGVAAEYSGALDRPIRYVNAPFDQWRDEELGRRNLSGHLCEHLLAMARLHAANRYDRLTHDVETITGKPATGIRDFVARNRALFARQVAA
jgi:NAD(P)H dehydrogenase (quinone)